MLECVILYDSLPIASVIEKNLLEIFTQNEELFSMSLLHSMMDQQLKEWIIFPHKI